MKTSRAAICFAVALVWSGSGIARAETPVVEAAPSSPQTTPPVEGPPSPQAPPPKTEAAKKIEAAKSTAKAAELTPIVPAPKDSRHPAFQLYAEIDLPILGIGLVFASARLVRPLSQKAFCAPLCDRGDLNALDRTTAGYWSPAWQDASNYGLAAVGVGAAAFLFADEGLLAGLNDAAVVTESALAATAVSSVMTLAAGRPRPFLYGEQAPLSARNGADADLSFLSSHASVAFAIATSMVVTTRRLHPHSRAAWVVAGVGGAMATFVATARVLGGMHFATDAAGGAVVGMSLGVLIPSLHGASVAIAPLVGVGQRGVALSAPF